MIDVDGRAGDTEIAARRWVPSLLLALIGASALSASCSDSFESCTETRTCDRTMGAGVGGDVAGLSGASASSSDAGTGGDATDEDNGGGGSANEMPDTEAPTVIDVSPADGAVGVEAKAAVVVTFSEPMNEDVTQRAYQSSTSGITAANVSFAWDSTGTQLTIKPKDPLAYAVGTVPADVKARSYAFVLDEAAEDRAGNPLKNELSVRFSTLRRLTVEILSSPFPLSGGYVVKDEGEYATEYTYAGCLEANEVFRTFVTFDLSSLPTDIETFELASRRLYQYSQSSNGRTPYEALGDLQLKSFAFASVNRAAFDQVDKPMATLVGKFGTQAMGYKSVDVADVLAADYESRNVSQYGVAFATRLNADLHHDIVYFRSTNDENPPTLDVTYLVP